MKPPTASSNSLTSALNYISKIWVKLWVKFDESSLT